MFRFALDLVGAEPATDRRSPTDSRDGASSSLRRDGAEPPVLARMLADAGASARVAGTAIEAAALAGAAAAAALPYRRGARRPARCRPTRHGAAAAPRERPARGSRPRC